MLSVNYTALVVFVVVWILVFLLTKLFFNPVRKIREEREGNFQRNSEEIQKALDSYNEGLLKIKHSLQSARAESERIKEKAVKEVFKEKSSLLAEIREESRKAVEKAKADLEVQKEELKKELSSKASFFAEEIARRMLN